MKITLIGPVYPFRGGIAHYTSHLALKLLADGYTTQVISFKRQYPAWLYPGVSDKDPSSQPLSVEAEYLLDPIYPWTWLQTARTINNFEPQIIVVMWWTTFWSPAFASLCWMLRKKSEQIIFVIHNVLPHEEKKWDRSLVRLTLSSGNGFIVHTEKEKERLQTILPSADMITCPIPLFDNLVQLRLSKSNARKLLGLSDRLPLLLSFGIVREYKGLSILLDALELLKRRSVNFFLLIAGEFWDDKAKYLQQIEKFGLQDNIRIEDRYIPDEEVTIMYSAVDVLIAPYVGGTQSGVASLGLGFGLPMIVSDRVAAGMYDQNQDLVTVTPSGDSELLADAIEKFINDEKKWQQNRNYPIDADQSWDNLIQGLVSFYDQSSQAAK